LFLLVGWNQERRYRLGSKWV